MLLADWQVEDSIKSGDIVIDPYRRDCLGPNSYDVHLGKDLLVYYDDVLDCRVPPMTSLIKIPEDGFVLRPGRLYLGVTEEYTETHRCVPYLDGKSSVGRLGIFIHATAGRGDVGFCNHWTLELMVVQLVKIYRGMAIGQLTYHECEIPEVNYGAKAGSKYQGRDPLPQPSRMYKNFGPRP